MRWGEREPDRVGWAERPTWEAGVPALLAYALHGRVGEAVVGLASITTPTAYRGEGHEVVQLGAGFPGCPVGAPITLCQLSRPQPLQGRAEKATVGTALPPQTLRPSRDQYRWGQRANGRAAHLSRFRVPLYLGLLTSWKSSGLWFSSMASLNT